MIVQFKKHSLLCALLAAVAMTIAAPYMIPANPDSAVFRSGTLGALLIFASFFPVRDALQKANRRELVCGLTLGLLFSAALSVGSELFVYDGLLRGLGSLVRRMAVPVLAAPLIGGLITRVLISMRSVRTQHTLNFPLWGYMLILLLCWLPLLLAYYPGMLNYDLNTEYRQFFYGEWDGRHPLLYIVLTYAVYAVGQLFGHPTEAILAVTLLRMAALAAALAYSCVFLQRRRAPAWAIVCLIGAYAFLPIFSVMSVSAAKDTPFAAALLALSLLCAEAAEAPQAFFSSKKRVMAFVLLTVFTWHLRKNGIAALALLLPLSILMLRSHRVKMATLCAVSVLASMLLGIGMTAAFKPFDAPSFQLYSLPAQQLVRAYELGDMTEAERDELKGWYADDLGLIAHPHLADPAKGYLNERRLGENGDAFMELWARIGKKNPRIYAEAFLMLNMGAWYPDDLTHASVYAFTTPDPKGYLQVMEYDFCVYGITSHSFLPKVKAFYDRMFALNEYQKLPLLPLLLCTATPFWLIVLACTALISQRRSRLLLPASGMLGLWVSYLFGPCTLPRYILPLFCLAPVMLILAMTRDEY